MSDSFDRHPYLKTPNCGPRCLCGLLSESECTEEWGPECDLGNNLKYAKVHTPEEKKKLTFDEWFTINVGPLPARLDSYNFLKRCWEAAQENK